VSERIEVDLGPDPVRAHGHKRTPLDVAFNSVQASIGTVFALLRDRPTELRTRNPKGPNSAAIAKKTPEFTGCRLLTGPAVLDILATETFNEPCLGRG